MKIVAWLVLAVVLLVVLGLLYYLLVGAFLFKLVFARKNISSKILQKDFESRVKKYKIDMTWWKKVNFYEVSIKSEDGLNLVGHFGDVGSQKTVIIFHGFGGSYIEMQPYCQFFYEKKFNVLAVDLRAHGQSEGNCVGYGLLDSRDVLSWVNFVQQSRPDDKILLFGLSMGGAAVCMASSLQMENVVGIISDCAFDNADRQIKHVMREHKIILALVKKHLYSYTKRLHGFDIMQADATSQVKKSRFPILFIHGLDDNFVPVENLNNLFNAAPTGMKDKLLVEGADHASAYAVGGASYEKKISEFLKNRTKIG